ncbi:chorion peroxidase [Trichonephila clavipes]|nr:chorion peroxidase [Trichonephila clavipes]
MTSGMCPSKPITETGSSFFEPITCVLVKSIVGPCNFIDESMFSNNSDSRRVFIRRVPGIRYHHSNMRESNQFGRWGTLVRGGIKLDDSLPLHIFDARSVTALKFKDEMFQHHVRLYRRATGQDFSYIDVDARLH